MIVNLKRRKEKSKISNFSSISMVVLNKAIWSDGNEVTRVCMVPAMDNVVMELNLLQKVNGKIHDIDEPPQTSATLKPAKNVSILRINDRKW